MAWEVSASADDSIKSLDGRQATFDLDSSLIMPVRYSIAVIFGVVEMFCFTDSY